MAALTIRNLAVDLQGRRIIPSLSYEFAFGRWTGVIGANGSGKTTLLRAIAGRLPIHGGGITLGGFNGAADRQTLARSIGFAPDASALPGSFTPREVFSIASEDLPADPCAIMPLREALGIQGLENIAIARMSAGMRQRVAIYLAFVRRTSIVILDEPFNWLDPVCAYDLKQVLKDFVRAENILLITALHDIATLSLYCDEGVLMTDGNIVQRTVLANRSLGLPDLASFEAEMIDELRKGSRDRLQARTS